MVYSFDEEGKIIGVDLHVHTLASDGSLPVRDVMQLAYDRGVRILALTDHETTQGVAEAQRMGLMYGIKVIPGVELLTSYRGEEVHLLGYYKDIDNECLQIRLRELREQRTAITYDMVECLQKDGLPLTWDDVEREASVGGVVSKGHIMRALYHGAKISRQVSWREVASYFQPGGIAYLPFLDHRFDEAVDFIYATGGVPVLAHPGILHNPQIVPELLAHRPIGLEVYYGYWKNREALISYYAELAKAKAILATGGSDYHGPFSQIQIGQIDVPLANVYELQDYLGIE